MIDKASRNKFAELIRSLASGLVTNDEFEDRLFLEVDFQDKAIIGVFSYGAWSLYSDNKEYRLKGSEALVPEEKTYAAKLVLFLRSNYEYEWPIKERKRSLLHKLTFGILGEIEPDPWLNVGDEQFWPFLNENQFNQAKKEFGYLGINRT